MLEAIFHGHAFVELATPEGSILIDPYCSSNPLCDCTKEQLAEKHLRAICLTHGHGDHLGDTLFLAGKTRCPVIGMVELCRWLQNQGVEHTESMNIGGTRHGDNRSVKFVRAFHSSSTPDGTYAGLAAGLIFRIGEKTIYHAGDTGLFAEMSSFTKYHFDLAFLPIGDRYTMGPEDALLAAERIKAKIVVPIHYDTFPEIKADPQPFAREIMSRGIGTPKVLTPGQAVVF